VLRTCSLLLQLQSIGTILSSEAFLNAHILLVGFLARTNVLCHYIIIRAPNTVHSLINRLGLEVRLVIGSSLHLV
jgi:hypothetical protein